MGRIPSGRGRTVGCFPFLARGGQAGVSFTERYMKETAKNGVLDMKGNRQGVWRMKQDFA